LSRSPIRTQFRTIDGLSLRYAESEERDAHALLVCPWPESLYAFEPTCSRLAESMRYVRTYPTELRTLRDLLPQVETPVQLIAGRRDSVVPPVNAEYLHKRRPKLELDIIDAGHFTWEDAADEYAVLVATWSAGGYATAGSAAAD
jgi:pimeloyl-ACP methyl ester carboxylesterase